MQLLRYVQNYRLFLLLLVYPNTLFVFIVKMIAGKRYHGLQTDIWSSGVVFYAMVAGYLPFEDPKTSNLYKKIMAADYQMPKFLSPECKDFVQKILNTEPETRIRISEIRNHPYMRGAQKDALSKTREPGLFPGL